MLKKLLVASAVLLLLAAGAYLAGGWAVGAMTREALPLVTREVARTGARVGRLDFASVSVRPLAAVSWQGWQIEVTPPATRQRPSPEAVRIRVKTVDATVASWSPLAATVRADGIVIDNAVNPEIPDDVPFAADEFSIPIEKIDEGFAELPALPLSRDRSALARELVGDLLKLAREGRTPRDLRAGARMHFRVNGDSFSARLETERRDGVTVLRLNRADLDEFATRYRRPLTDDEKQILHEYPLRAPLLVRIMTYAERTAKRLSRLDRGWGEDYTRHVLWSFWLTRTYGAEFAERVTNAHEAGGEIESEAEHQQDFANNATGRRYASENKSEGQVLKLIKTDPLIVRIAR